MTGIVSLVIAVGAILWLLARDAKERPELSPAVWLALAWVVLIAFRPVTSWLFGADPALDLPASRDDGHPLEALVALSLIATGVLILFVRSVSWGTVVVQNGWLTALYVFWLATALWSDYPLITVRRLTKDFGHIVMLLVLLTERNPSAAVRATLTRCAYIGLPLSLVLIRYYPSLGRAYVGYHGDVVMYVGVTTHKNSLGILAVVGIFSLAWDLLARRRAGRAIDSLLVAQTLVLLTSCYVLVIADSATSLLSLLLGVTVLGLLALPVVRRLPWLLEGAALYTVSVACAAWTVLGLSVSLLNALGRDATLTSRLDIWPAVLDHAENRLVGAGFNTFWAGERLRALQRMLGDIIQAHNGYIETYLNGGLVGLGLLLVVLVSAYLRLKHQLSRGGLDTRIRLTLLLIALVHNVAEASFNTQSLLWFVTLFAVMTYEPWTTKMSAGARIGPLRPRRRAWQTYAIRSSPPGAP